MKPTLRIYCPDPENVGDWRVETPDGERLRGVTRAEIKLDAETRIATAVVTFVGVHVDVKAQAARQISLADVDQPMAPGEAPEWVSEATLPTE